MSARPSGKLAAASIFSGNDGVKRIASAAIRLLGNVMMATFAVSRPSTVSMLTRRPERSTSFTGQPSLTGTPAACAAIAVP